MQGLESEAVSKTPVPKAPIDLTKIIFSAESMLSLKEEMSELNEKHWEEITHFKDIPLEPDWERYQKLEETGHLIFFTAREHGKLIGYNSFFLATNAHYKSSKQANQDVIYIDPDRRGFGKYFIHWCDEQLKKLDIQVVYHHVKVKHNFGPLLEKQGYELIDQRSKQ